MAKWVDTWGSTVKRAVKDNQMGGGVEVATFSLPIRFRGGWGGVARVDGQRHEWWYRSKAGAG